MDAETYSNAAQGAARQPLGGKEIRFPFSGQSSVITSNRLGVSYTPASVNVILRSPGNWDKCGGTRPGLKAFTGTQPATPSPGHWLWPNGEAILWPNGDNVAFSEIGSKVVMPGGGVLFDVHETFNVGASKGAVPDSFSACAWYRDRMVVSNGTMWYASRLGTHDDFDYGCDIADVARAVAGNVALAGREGETITALAAIADSMMYIATKRSLWRVTGEVTQSLSLVSDHIGMVSRHAWCWDGMHFWFWSDKGLYALVAGEPPVAMTPHLEDVVRGWNAATLIFDSERNGIHVLGTDGSSAATDWFYDIANRALWKLQYPSAKRPTSGGLAMLGGKNRVVFLCADGTFRYWDEAQATDDGTNIVSALAMGPVTHTTGDTENAFLAELDFEMDADITSQSGVNVSGCVGRTSNEAVKASVSVVGWAGGGASGTSAYEKFRYSVIPGWQRVVRPRIRCNSFAAVVWSTAGRWAVSKITAVHRGCGRIRR